MCRFVFSLLLLQLTEKQNKHIVNFNKRNLKKHRLKVRQPISTSNKILLTIKLFFNEKNEKYNSNQLLFYTNYIKTCKSKWKKIKSVKNAVTSKIQ